MYPDPSEGPLRPDLAIVICDECRGEGHYLAWGADNMDCEVETCEHCGGSGQCEDQECDCCGVEW